MSVIITFVLRSHPLIVWNLYLDKFHQYIQYIVISYHDANVPSGLIIFPFNFFPPFYPFNFFPPFFPFNFFPPLALSKYHVIIIINHSVWNWYIYLPASCWKVTSRSVSSFLCGTRTSQGKPEDIALATESYHHASLVVTGSTIDCRNGNLRCCLWRLGWPIMYQTNQRKHT